MPLPLFSHLNNRALNLKTFHSKLNVINIIDIYSRCISSSEYASGHDLLFRQSIKMIFKFLLKHTFTYFWQFGVRKLNFLWVLNSAWDRLNSISDISKAVAAFFWFNFAWYSLFILFSFFFSFTVIQLINNIM